MKGSRISESTPLSKEKTESFIMCLTTLGSDTTMKTLGPKQSLYSPPHSWKYLKSGRKSGPPTRSSTTPSDFTAPSCGAQR